MVRFTHSSTAAGSDQMKNSGLSEFFRALLSVVDLGKYEPHVEVYRWAAGRVEAEMPDFTISLVGELPEPQSHGYRLSGRTDLNKETEGNRTATDGVALKDLSWTAPCSQ